LDDRNHEKIERSKPEDDLVGTASSWSHLAATRPDIKAEELQMMHDMNMAG